MKEWDQDNVRNINNHGGYQIEDLFVHRKYPAFKDELMNYQDLNAKQYHQIILPKLKKYAQTRKFKSMIPNIPYDIYSNYMYDFRPRYGERCEPSNLIH